MTRQMCGGTMAECRRQPYGTEETMETPKYWASIRVGLYHEGPDNKSAMRIFGWVKGYTVALTTRDGTRDVRVLDVGEGDDDDSHGFLVKDTGDAGEFVPGAHATFVRYEDVDEIGVY